MSNSLLTPTQCEILLDVAAEAIEHQLTQHQPLPVTHTHYDATLQAKRATFVTLHLQQQLRGCIGILEAHQALVNDVAQNAHAAAFKDPRFSPVTASEAGQLQIHVSVLNPAEEIPFSSEQDLIAQLQSGIDGLILEEGENHRATFLPSVWQQLPSPQEFLKQLKQKARLPVDYWSETLRIYRYTTESFGVDQ